MCYSVLQCVTVCYSVLQCVTVCYSVLQCVTVCYSVLKYKDNPCFKIIHNKIQKLSEAVTERSLKSKNDAIKFFVFHRTLPSCSISKQIIIKTLAQNLPNPGEKQCLC